MTKKEIKQMTNEELISLIAWKMFSPTRAALKDQKWCIEELEKRGIVNADDLMVKLDIAET